VPDDHTIGEERIDPHVVVVPAGRHAADREAPVRRPGVGGSEEVHLVPVVGSRHGAGVVERSLSQGVGGIHHVPCATAIIGAPQDALELVQRLEIPVRVGLDQRVDPVRIVQ
jgi:hypothetical protein